MVAGTIYLCELFDFVGQAKSDKAGVTGSAGCTSAT